MAPLLEELEKLEGLKRTFPAYADVIDEAMFRVQGRIDELGESLDEQEEQIKETADLWQSLGPTFASAFEDAIVEGERLSDVLNALEKDILRIITRKAVTEPLVAGLGNLFGNATGGLSNIFGNLFGAAQGASFTVGGSGGTDSQLVAFRATPGETVDVRTPAQQRAGATYNFNFMLPDDTSTYRRAGEQAARSAARYLQTAQATV